MNDLDEEDKHATVLHRGMFVLVLPADQKKVTNQGLHFLNS
jgi:hypothetical protein